MSAAPTKDIAVEIVARGDKSLIPVLRSIRAQSAMPTRTIVCTSRRVSRALGPAPLGVEFVDCPDEYGLLAARRLAHTRCRERNALLVDGTRELAPECIEAVTRILDVYDMAAIPEAQVGRGFWSRAASIDKRATGSTQAMGRALTASTGVVLPRAFRSDLLSRSFASLSGRIVEPYFTAIRWGDHHLIYNEARKWSSNVGVVDGQLIFHHADESLASVTEKYWQYGRSLRVLRRAEPAGDEVSDLFTHVRQFRGLTAEEALIYATLLTVRTSSFIAGATLGELIGN